MNRKQRPSIGMHLQLGRVIEGRMEQRMKLSPPVSNDIAEVTANMPQVSPTTKPKQEMVHAIDEMIKTEDPTNPLTDSEIVAILEKQDMPTTNQEVYAARLLLDIPASLARKVQ